MAKQIPSRRLVFVEAEKIASDFPLLLGKRPEFLKDPLLQGVMAEDDIDSAIAELRRLSVDEYISRSVSPSENPKRKSAPEVIRQLGGEVISEVQEGPMYLAEMEFRLGERRRRLIFLAQNRKAANGVWMPRHHERAAKLLRFYSSYGMPVITFIDTPGADAGEEANRAHQAHSISLLIAEMANLQLPTVGVIFGNGYSGGAIPLATCNVLLSVRDGVFNTIHPTGLSEIAYHYNLSWQECAKYIGVSAYELYRSGHLDGVIDYSPLETGAPVALSRAIFSALESVEHTAFRMLADRRYEFFFQHYKESIGRYLHPSELLVEENRIADKTPTGMLNVFGSVYRFHRYLKLRMRLRSQSTVRYSRVDRQDPPEGELQDRLEREQQQRFSKWCANPLEIRYDEALSKRYTRLLDTYKDLGVQRSRIATFFVGRPETNYRRAAQELTLELALHLYNFWKVGSRENFLRLLPYLEGTSPVPPKAIDEADLMDALNIEAIREQFPGVIKNLVLFDLFYDKLVEHLPLIAAELKDHNEISQASMEDLSERVFQEAAETFKGIFAKESESDIRENFFDWLEQFTSRRDTETLMRQVSEWKRLAFPRLSEPLFGVVSYYFSNLMPSFYAAQRGGKFSGKINPRHIGIKDFWNRLTQAYQDLLIQNLLAECKRKTHISPEHVIDRFFTGFRPMFEDLMTANPVRFPGFRQSIERALDAGVPPVGVITGLAQFEYDGISSSVGLVVSNSEFQAGAFDMASGEKVCKLMVECAEKKLPLVMFISSGGMQTKEGAGALFSMAVLNDRLTRFVKDFDLPVICFGFRDCTGGAQASFVTHRLVKTFYLSGCVMPFAGQRVVPSHLPVQATLANYLSQVPGGMDGLVINPFDEGLDERLREIDPSIAVPTESIPEAIAHILRGEYKPVEAPLIEEPRSLEIAFEPVRRLLVHARGGTATRLIDGAHAAGCEVVLVQSDADMEGYPASRLRPQDRLVCLGGNTPQESYLNGMSVIRIAQQEEADAIHPGIGFLSENPSYAKLCRKHGFNFIGPRDLSMERMGNKSNAIATARKLGVGVVPGSQGVLTDSVYAKSVADEIGYPVLIKAAFGGGGKGMCVVRAAEEFDEAFARTSQEALSAFGNGDVYLEKFVEFMRHLEVQVLRDRHGNTQILGLRDCTVQRNNQKLVEESGSYRISAGKLEEIFGYAERIAQEVDYLGAGTIEFIFDRGSKAVYFMEMNTRLQVEHPVTEMVSEVDIVVEQIRIASGKSIEKLKPKSTGYAMEVRINAERMELGESGSPAFAPAPGTVTRFHVPEHPKVRTIPAVGAGMAVPPYYDSLILQVIARDRNRAAVIRTLRDYLKDIVIEGVGTNLGMMEAILEDPVFQNGDYDTGFLSGFYERNDLLALVARVEGRSGARSAAINRDAISIDGSEELKVLAPHTGVFYSSPTPDDPPFVELGGEFDIDQTLCLLEAMKVFENISLADFNRMNGDTLFDTGRQYKLNRILAESGQTVNQGDLLFIVQPAPVGANAP
ncbi:MAG: ATP-grasp domain-containing protein [SAR324 cluster bacterium]|nr:ATP-grasp domain-containing protein [SAR324 cluster bacterium]